MNEERASRRESGFRHAWAVLFAMSVATCLLSLPYLFAARSLEPKATRIVDQASAVSPDLGHFVRCLLRLIGLNWLTSGILAALIAATGFRRGDTWAWYAHWAIAAYWLGDSTIDMAAGGSGWKRGYLWTALMMATLLVSPQARRALSPSHDEDRARSARRVNPPPASRPITWVGRWP
jgi:hypothetical protein